MNCRLLHHVRTGIFACALVIYGLFSSAAVQAFDRESVQALLDSPKRELSDRLRDPLRKPLEVVEFLGIDEGMEVLEVYAGGGYLAVVLAAVVGPEGVVLAQNSPRALSFQEDRTDTTAGQALDEKIKSLGLSNIVRMDQSFNDISLPPNSLDAVLASQIFHDYYNGNPAAANRMLLKIKAALKPGGVLGVIDHYGKSGLDNRRLHRIVKEDVISALEQAGFVVEAESEILRNPKDQYARSIFDPMLNRHTDQFLLRVRKPLN